jgi:hypothetical protein
MSAFDFDVVTGPSIPAVLDRALAKPAQGDAQRRHLLSNAASALVADRHPVEPPTGQSMDISPIPGMA